CDGDRRDEITKSFESCAFPDPVFDFPKSFRTKCEDWAGRSESGGYFRNVEKTIREQVVGYLEQLEKKCPGLRCKRQDAECRFAVTEELEKCKKIRGSAQCEFDASEG